MKEFHALIMPLLRGGQIRYLDGGVAKSMSAEYFTGSFRKQTAFGDAAAGQITYLYQSIEHPGFVICFRVSGEDALSASLLRQGDFAAHANAA